MHFAERPLAAWDPLPGMFDLHDASVAARRRSNEQWFLSVGVAAPVARIATATQP